MLQHLPAVIAIAMKYLSDGGIHNKSYDLHIHVRCSTLNDCTLIAPLQKQLFCVIAVEWCANAVAVILAGVYKQHSYE